MAVPDQLGITRKRQEERPMWKKPAFTDLRIGFEVTMYFASR
jgi:pyrroloquinoline quinone biosynthesis protein A